jgi:hypothetical protein
LNTGIQSNNNASNANNNLINAEKIRKKKNLAKKIFAFLNVKKKDEKVRIFKENEIIEALFNFRQTSISERKFFEKISTEIMIEIAPELRRIITKKTPR